MLHPKKRSRLAALLLLVSCASCFSLGLLGIDFGYHWDEARLVDAVVQSFATSLFLPRWYNYPSLSYDLCALLGLGVRLTKATELGGPTYYLLVRSLFLAVATAALPVTFWVSRLLLGPGLRAVIAPLLLAGSWEFAYQARWIAPDMLVTTLSWVTMALCLEAVRTGAPPLTWIAAMTASLAFGAKYPAGLALVPVLYVVVTRERQHPWRMLGLVAAHVLLFGLVFVAVTPGALAEPHRLLVDVYGEVGHYAIRGHGGHNVGRGFPHLALIVAYFVTSGLSPYLGLSLALFGAAAVGGARFAWRAYAARDAGERAQWSVFLLFPCAYTLLFSLQKAMIVRNLLVLFPFMALCCAEGLVYLSRRLSLKVSVSLLAAALATNVAWLTRAALSIRAPSPDVWTFSSRPPEPVWIDLALRGHIEPSDLATVDDPAAAMSILFNPKTVKEAVRLLPANHRGTYQVASNGSFEVNLDYYPNWAGRGHAVAMDRALAESTGVLADLLGRSDPNAAQPVIP